MRPCGRPGEDQQLLSDLFQSVRSLIPFLYLFIEEESILQHRVHVSLQEGESISDQLNGVKGAKG